MKIIRPERDKLEELSNELPERERKDLLDKINRRMQREDREEVVAVSLEDEERERLIQEEMDQLSGWVRFWLWLRALFSGRSRRDLFLRHKISQLKGRIRQRDSGLTGFESRDLTPRFAQRLFDLYSAAHPLLGLFRSFHTDPDFQKVAVLHLVEAHHLDSRVQAEQIIPVQDLEELFARTGSEEELRKLVLRRFNDYLKGIPSRLFDEMEAGLDPLFYLKHVVLFPYGVLFRHFGYGPPIDRLEDRYPFFQHAPAMLVLDLLERLYYAVYLCLRLEKDWQVHEELLRSYLLNTAEQIPDESLVGQELAGLTRTLVQLARQAEEFATRVPIMDIIRYFRRDPYYRLAFSLPRYNLRAVYATTARAMFLRRLEDQMDAIKGRVIDRKLRELFRDSRQLSLFYYVPGSNGEGPSLVHSRSLAALYNFLVQMYKGGIQEAVHLTSAYLLANNRITQSRLMQFAYGLEELEAKIVLFDRSLSPDEDDGKALTRFRSSRAMDIEEQKRYRMFTVQKNREAQELIGKGRENLMGIKQTFIDLLTSPAENVRAVLRTLHGPRGRSETLQQILKGNTDLITDYCALLDQMLALEKGS